MTDSDGLLVEDEDDVRTMTLNRPQMQNAVDLELTRAIDAALTEPMPAPTSEL